MTTTNGVEERVAKIWAKLFNIPLEDCKGDFFDLGGHSLLAMRMLNSTNTEFGIKPDIGAFLLQPTLSAYAELIQQELCKEEQTYSTAQGVASKASTWELIELRAAPIPAPIIVAINHPMFYYVLAKQFSDRVAITNLYIPGSGQVATQSSLSFEELAFDAARLILERYPGRPVTILGLCVNGRVALKVAQLLQQSGQDIANVVMIDTWAPGAIARQSRLKAMRLRWGERFSRWSHYLRQWGKGRMSTVELIGENRFGAALVKLIGQTPAEVEDVRLLVDVTKHLLSKTRDHTFAPYDGDVTLFKTAASPTSVFETRFGWGEIVCDETPVYSASGWHEDALSSESVGSIANIIEVRTLRSARSNNYEVGAGEREASGQTSAA